MSKLDKYQILENGNLSQLDVEINSFVEQGYKLHTFRGIPTQSEYLHSTNYVAVMSLSSPSKYDEISNLRDVQPHEVDDLLDEGWQVADSWAKVVRMVKKKEN